MIGVLLMGQLHWCAIQQGDKQCQVSAKVLHAKYECNRWKDAVHQILMSHDRQQMSIAANIVAALLIKILVQSIPQ